MTVGADRNAAFIAFKVPAHVKAKLRQTAEQRGLTLSKLLRLDCLGLPPNPVELFQMERDAAGQQRCAWLRLWR